MEKELVSEKRGYLLRTVAEAKEIVLNWLREINLVNAIKLGLPEVDDRYHIWRIPLCNEQKKTVGEVVIDAYTTEILLDKTTRTEIIIARLLKQDESKLENRKKTKKEYKLSSLRNTIGFGDCSVLLEEMPRESVDLIFTSPPYFNARPEYSEFEEYESYLLKLRQVIRKCHRVLSEGRFFVINISPVLLRRASRNQASKRIAVPFDLHRIFIEEGYDFIDDIIWLKPEGAGWATGRGRRFAADRNPLQYKTVPVTEYVLVYRKHTDLLIDWHIRNHPDQEVVKASKIADGYERTNVWKINPVTNSKHPAAFPVELAEKVITYYSFKGDVVLDPFAGSGTVGLAAASLDRRFVLFESNFNYIELIRKLITEGNQTDLDSIIWLNCPLEN
ncbi:MAG: site-specific DNA-methyltransferase [Microcystis panniformis Mp_MB_F_20051200_S9]|uniref:Methyltransferase n=1 Tax=Microcystis panniformis Mp_MB_F_20051200_S9 TaxID=2486223 RepID=A0A552PX04_9CHRO|nr:MAG: site-specific DNA-methyltransferase [Microcystis panniformis Mp_MB_F_20080800_S26D]TRV48549.1 MAG: site-specific DNA-methyltransferase [Microcystis panniformis Mp_GB_SS_20050300_S99D]TRV53853.1 MAG: site-specific DNA-methyltransferase [Microcystis panniformis Mp_GB_SS_20050300_S99]TRV61507.1 MAG: site-specific DNA-methyltransferase [Microcystis panniformis Mp_MB_F_20051200_S9]TRV64841.1 MAG: site-specific DNA-methyltransferase [Microcystis panniformis Mp_MB_F_20080800_S26]TRV67443.1 MA